MQHDSNNLKAPPKVSVIMTTYNGASHVPHSVSAILDQTFRDFELIVVDDGSSDKTMEVLRGFNDERIRLEPNPQNMGISLSRNRALSLARGQYIACNDQDDISSPSRLEKQVEFLKTHPEAVLVSAAVQINNGEKTWGDPMPTYRQPQVLHASLFFGQHNITYSSICIRASTLKEHQLTFRQEFHYAEDFEFYHQVAKIGSMVTLPDILVTSRIHGANASWSHEQEMAANGRRFLSKEYAELLGHKISDDDMKLIWRILVRKLGAKSVDELHRIGQLMAKTIDAFKQHYLTTETERQEIDQFAAKTWWKIVRAGAESGIGLTALRMYRRLPELSAYTPPATERAYSAIKSATPFFVRDLIKKGVGKADSINHK